MADWPADPDGVAARVAKIPDDYVRTAVIVQLADTWPGATRGLCPSLPPGLSRSRCERLNARPHLSVVAGDAQKGAGAAAGGAPDGRTSGQDDVSRGEDHAPELPDVRLAVPAPRTPPAADLCAEEADRPACLDHAAVDASLHGDPGRATAICGAHTEARWADECRFNAAERLVESKSGQGYRNAAILCGTSEGFATECQTHILTWLPRTIPDASAPKGAAANANTLARTVAATWEATPDAAESYMARFWALYFANVYLHTGQADGTPLGVYDPSAWPHVRSALATKLRATGALHGTFDEQAGQLRAALARREERTSQRGPRPGLVSVRALGTPDDPDTTWFLGAALRPVSDDPELDTRFALMASAARANPPDRALLEEASGSAETRVASEATRLLAALTSSPG